jgi:polar amino acid transport system ATP-binding protein
LKFALKLLYLYKNKKLDQKYIKNGLETCKDKYPNELSGQRQRTAIIEQLFSSRLIVVLDDLFRFDIGNIEEVKSFEQVQPDHIHTFLHDIELAIELANQFT